MRKHHSEDYKISAIKHYLNKTKNLTKTCEEFQCSRISLKRGVEIYKQTGTIKRNMSIVNGDILEVERMIGVVKNLKIVKKVINIM